jgi:hypothetical protein
MLARMPKSAHRPDPLQGKIFVGRAALRRRLLTPAQLRGPAWRPLFRGIYADTALTITHQLRCQAVSRYLLPSDGAIAGRSAAALYGFRESAVSPASGRQQIPRHCRIFPASSRRGVVHGADAER